MNDDHVTDGGPEVPVTRGARYDASDPAALRRSLRAIVDYRGDVTITRRSDPAPVSGYVFECVPADDVDRIELRLLPADGGSRVTIPLADVEAIEVTGRDTAEGKSFETWVKKYVERKIAERGQATQRLND